MAHEAVFLECSEKSIGTRIRLKMTSSFSVAVGEASCLVVVRSAAEFGRTSCAIIDLKRSLNHLLSESTHECPVPEIAGILLRSKWAVGKTQGGSISESIRDRRATQPPAHFHRNPPGRGQLAVFPPPRRIDPYDSDMGASLAPRKIRRGGTSGKIPRISGTGH